jgi:hypothetical protein
MMSPFFETISIEGGVANINYLVTGTRHHWVE